MRALAAVIVVLAVLGLASALSDGEKAGLARLEKDWPILLDGRQVAAPWNLSFESACNYFTPEMRMDGWTGLVCDSSGSVVQLSLNGVGLHSDFSEGLRSFPSLRILGLYGTGLTGTIPDWIFRMNSLKELYLGINQLKGEIPAAVSGSRLKQLYLDHNRLSGTIPSLPNGLQSLWLTGNRLTLCPSNLPASINSCNFANQTFPSCGAGCAEAIDKLHCVRDPIPTSCEATEVPHEGRAKTWIIPVIVVPILCVGALLLFLFTKTKLRYSIMHCCGQQNVPGYSSPSQPQQYAALPTEEI